VATGEDTSDFVQWIKFSGASWTNDNRGFFYSRFPAPRLDAATGKTFSDLAGQRLYYHRLGETQAQDQLIYELPDQPRWLISAQVSDDGRYAFIGISRGDSNNTLLSYIDLGNPAAPNVHHPVVPLIREWTARYWAPGYTFRPTTKRPASGLSCSISPGSRHGEKRPPPQKRLPVAQRHPLAEWRPLMKKLPVVERDLRARWSQPGPPLSPNPPTLSRVHWWLAANWSC